MSRQRARELIEEWLENDRRNCEDFQSEFQFNFPTLEARLGFTEFRLKRWGGVFMAIFRELSADDESAPPARQGEP